jgi:hypothetical protein
VIFEVAGLVRAMMTRCVANVDHIGQEADSIPLRIPILWLANGLLMSCLAISESIKTERHTCQ